MGEGILNIIKIILTLLLFPFLYIFATRFHHHLTVYPNNPQDFFLFGVMGFLLVFLFIYQFFGVFEVGQKITGQAFRFAAPLDKFMANCVPFYPVVIMLLFYIVRNLFKFSDWNHQFLFFAGFTMAMHVLLVAQDLQGEERGVFRPNYFFSISVVFLANILVMILLMDLVYGKFTLFNFFKNNFFDVKLIYHEAYKLVTAGRN
jgi:hypothetical protein